MRLGVLGHFQPLSFHTGMCSWRTGLHVVPERAGSQGLTDVTCTVLISLFHRAASLHNNSFCASLWAPKQPQLVRNFYRVHWGKPLPQPLCQAAQKGRKICTSVSQMQKQKDQATLNGGFTIRKFPPFTSHIWEKKRKSGNKEGIILAFLDGRAKSSFSYQRRYFCILPNYGSNKLFSVLTFVSGFRLVEI